MNIFSGRYVTRYFLSLWTTKTNIYAKFVWRRPIVTNSVPRPQLDYPSVTTLNIGVLGEHPGTQQRVTNDVIMAIVTCQHTRGPRQHTLLLYLGSLQHTACVTHQEDNNRTRLSPLFIFYFELQASAIV